MTWQYRRSDKRRQTYDADRVGISTLVADEKIQKKITQMVKETLTEGKDEKHYIKRMRSRAPELSFRWGTICTPVRMVAQDGKEVYGESRIVMIWQRKYFCN